jgi:hypothetical protein
MFETRDPAPKAWQLWKSTLRLWERNEPILTSGGFVLDDVREARDRPGMEFVFIARRGDLPGRVRRGQ